MVIGRSKLTGRAAFLAVDIVVAMALILVALVPLVASFGREASVARRYYERAVVAELVDGEFEVLQAGAWRHYPTGTQAYAVAGWAVTNLPPGRFWLTVTPPHLRLEWKPDGDRGGAVVREGGVR